jgi:diadenosine tetraphosphatase ApaH/serine/threonine PP2A family protein phosphatase
MPEASDSDLEKVFRSVGRPLAVYGHIHRPFIRPSVGDVSGMTVANCGSVGLPHDGDRRAAYLLADNGVPAIRRVEYDVDKELRALSKCSFPHSEWVARILATARPQMP